MFKSIKAIIAGFVIVIGTTFFLGMVLAFTIYPIIGRLAPNVGLLGIYLVQSVVAVFAGLLSGHFISLIAGRREIAHTLVFLGFYLAWQIFPSLAMMKNWANSVNPTEIFRSIGAACVVAIFALIAAFRVSRKRAQQGGPADALSGAADL